MKKIVKLKTNHLDKFGLNGSGNYIVDYLATLGIDNEKAKNFLGDSPMGELSPNTLKNMDKAATVAMEMMSQGPDKCNVFVQVDSDADGYTSASLLINYLQLNFPNIKIHWHLHSGKQHGIDLKAIPEECNLIFVPDAGSNQVEEQKILTESGKTVIILDHHEFDEEATKDSGAIIVNSQASGQPEFTNKFLSGAGVTFKFIQWCDEVCADMRYLSDQYFDLAAIGIIGDMMDLTTLDNNFIVYHGLKRIYNPLIREIAVKQSRGIKDINNMTKIDVAFYIVPIINGVIRSGSMEDKEFFFKALTTEECDGVEQIYTREWRGVTYNENLYECAARLAINAKSRQDTSKKKSFEWICKLIRENGYDKHNIIIVPLSDADSSKVSANVTGLIATELVKEFNKPCLVLRSTTVKDKSDGETEIPVFGGSGRNGNSFYGLPDLKAALNEAGGYYQEGHANAFGSFLLSEQIDQVRNFFDSKYDSKTFDSVYFVDCWFNHQGEINKELLMEIASHNELWGNSIPEPKFAFDVDDFDPSTMLRTMGKNGDSLKINLTGGVDCVAFSKPKLIEDLKAVQPGDGTVLTIIGRAQINEWNGFKNIQIMIDDIIFNKKDDIESGDIILDKTDESDLITSAMDLL